MTKYLVLSEFTSSTVSLLTITKASVFFFIVGILLPFQHKPEADVYHLISSHPGVPEPSYWYTIRGFR
jgi:hypothetical protein